jgi:NADP-dependent 3-hydroxy acid dehydrogenase YdfG
VTGAGSGIGEAAARRAAAAGWRVVLSGRRVAQLEVVARAIIADGGGALVARVDVQDSSTVTEARDSALAAFGRIDAVVLAAGLNTLRRTWANQRLSEFDDVVATNLLGPARVIDTSLPQLRMHAGVVVIVSSFSAWAFTPTAGVAYSASKSALAQLARTLNVQEAGSGVRACHLCPGDVATAFLDQRPHVPDARARAAMLSPDDVARTIEFVLESPAHVRFDELVISPVSQV